LNKLVPVASLVNVHH